MQIFKYKWGTQGLSGEPFLFAREGKEITKMELFDKELSLTFGKRYCVGYTKNGKHFECPNKRTVDTEKMCRECGINDDFFLCMKCDGSDCGNEPQRKSCEKNKYYIYLAAFNTMLKVGISYEHRVLERLIEQGADMGAKIGFIQDGKEARLVEQKIRKELKIHDRISGVQKQNMLFGNINAAAINIFGAFTKLRGNDFLLKSPEIYNLQSIYRIKEVKEKPKQLEVKDGLDLKGKVVAAKGNIIILKNGPELFSVNAHRLVGCEIKYISYPLSENSPSVL